MKNKNDKIYLTETQKDFLQYCRIQCSDSLAISQRGMLDYTLSVGYYYNDGNNQKCFNGLRTDYTVKYMEFKK